jgi:outer membrane protein
MTWHKRIVAVCLLALFMNTLALPVRAQEPKAGDSGGVVTGAQDNSQTLPEPPKVNLPRDRTGVDQNKVLNLSLRDAISMGLEHNLDIQVERDNIKIAEYNLLSAYGVYDPLVDSQFFFNRVNNPTGSALEAGTGSLSTLSDSYTYNFGFSKLLDTGGQFTADFDNTRSTTNLRFATLNPQFSPRVNFTFRQPLLRNFKNDVNQRNIRRLKKELDISDLTFRQRLIDLIARVQTAYYNLAFALRNEEIQRESVDLAAVQLRNNQIQVKAGTAAPIDIVSAEAALESRKDAAIAALLDITEAENALKTLILDDPNSDVWNHRIITESIDFTPEPIDLTSALNIAMDRRPEIKQLELQSELNKIELDFLKNQEKPQVDFIASFGGRGLAGTSRTAAPPPTGDPTTPPTTISNPFEGGYATALSNIFDFRSYQVGVVFSFPLRNRTAKANISRTLVSNTQLEAKKRQMVQSIVTDVRNALQAVETARQRVEAAHAAVVAAEAQLKGEEQKFAVGLSTNFFVLQRQNELSIARGNELRAKTDYNIARANLQRVMANNVP